MGVNQVEVRLIELLEVITQEVKAHIPLTASMKQGNLLAPSSLS
jgi:hypothetical protein